VEANINGSHGCASFHSIPKSVSVNKAISINPTKNAPINRPILSHFNVPLLGNKFTTVNNIFSKRRKAMLK
jgi:hypothetical protein